MAHNQALRLFGWGDLDLGDLTHGVDWNLTKAQGRGRRCAAFAATALELLQCFTGCSALDPWLIKLATDSPSNSKLTGGDHGLTSHNLETVFARRPIRRTEPPFVGEVFIMFTQPPQVLRVKPYRILF